MFLHVVRLQHWCQKLSQHVSDQIMMLMSVLLLLVHMPLCRLYDCCLTTMEWTEMMMQTSLLLFHLLLRHWYDCCLSLHCCCSSPMNGHLPTHLLHFRSYWMSEWRPSRDHHQ